MFGSRNYKKSESKDVIVENFSPFDILTPNCILHVGDAKLSPSNLKGLGPALSSRIVFLESNRPIIKPAEGVQQSRAKGPLTPLKF